MQAVARAAFCTKSAFFVVARWLWLWRRRPALHPDGTSGIICSVRTGEMFLAINGPEIGQENESGFFRSLE